MYSKKQFILRLLAAMLVATCILPSALPLCHAENEEIYLSGEELVEDMKIGWNLGNTLDCYNVENPPEDFETAWGNPKTTFQMIEAVKNAGFNAVRIPITWNEHMDGSTVDSAWLQRVGEVVGYVLDNGMYAIINVHHDDYTWLCPSYEKESEAASRYTALWSQISEYFKDYGNKLLFEAMNEPRVVGEENEWSIGTAESREVVNRLNALFVQTVRGSGGKNDHRFLIVPTHAASSEEAAINDFVLPDSHNLIVSVHYYFPYDFVLNEDGTADWGSEEDKAALDSGFDRVKKRFADKGIPVIIGEFGVTCKNNDSTRREYFNYFIKSAKKRGFTCFVWDNGIEDEFGLLNRSTCTWWHEDVVRAMISASTVKNISLTYKSSLKLTPAVNKGDTVSYEVADKNVLYVDSETGFVTTVGEGQTEVVCTVTSPDGKIYSETYNITVTYTWWQWIVRILFFGWLWY